MLISVISLFFFSPKGTGTESFGNNKKGGKLCTRFRRREKKQSDPSGSPPLMHLGVRDRSQTLVRGPDAKKGPLVQNLNFLTLVKGALKQNSTNFPVKIEFTCVSLGLTRNFHGKKEPWNFLRSKRGARKIFAIYFFASGPPYKCLWTVP